MVIWVVGIGPGNAEGMTYEARLALEEAEIIVGYKAYVDLVKKILPEKEYFDNSMGGEKARCEKTIEFALAGKNVALICSGDAGVYGMASLLLELAEKNPDLEIEIIAGVTAAHSGSARLGAPLSHDYVVLSLSDYLTPLDLIEKRLRLCADADLCMAIYNPRSKARPDCLKWAAEILLEYKSGQTCCGYVRNIGRDGEEFGTLFLHELGDFPADMFTTIYIGNRESRVIHGKLVTPRGYQLS